MGYSSLIFLALVFACVQSKWATPIEITSYIDPIKISKTIYTDPSSGVSHIAYCNSSDGALYYAHLDDTGLFLTGPTALTTEQRCYHAEITGPGDGLNVYLTLEARRTMSVDECTPENPSSCDDFYVFESTDGGQTWQQPKVAGGASGDIVRRRTYKLLTNWKTKYFWMMYTRSEPKDSGIAIARYNTETHKFDKDHMLVSKFAGLSQYPLLTFNEKGETNIQLVYATPYTLTLQTFVSTDLGETWKKGEPMKGVCAGPKMVIRTLLSKGKYLVAGCTKAEVLHFSFSEDNGKTWTVPALYPQKNVEEVSFCSRKETTSPLIDMLVLFRDKKNLFMAHSPVPALDGKVIDVPDAFYFAAYKMDINCYYRNDELKVRFMYHVRTPLEGASKYTMYVIDNDNIVDTPKREIKADL